MKQSRTEQLGASTAVILGIIADKQALLRSPAAATNVAVLAGHRWRLTKAFYNYRWFIKSIVGASVGTGHYDARIMAVLVAVDDVNAALRAYVLHWSNGDNAARWPDYQAAAGATLDEIASAVRRLPPMPRRSCTMPQRRRSAAPPPADPPAAPCRAIARSTTGDAPALPPRHAAR